MLKGANKKNKSNFDSKKSLGRTTTMVITKKKPPNPPGSDSAISFTPNFSRDRSLFRANELTAAHIQPEPQPQSTKNKRSVN